MPPQQGKRMTNTCLPLDLLTFFERQTEASFLAVKWGTFPIKLRQIIDFLPNLPGEGMAQSLPCDRVFTEELGGAVAGVQGNSLVRLWEDHHAGRTK